MFDNTKFNIILLCDATSPVFMQRVYGTDKLAAVLQTAGFETLVINHLHVFSVEEIKDILCKTISSKTLFVGVNSFFYQNIESPSIGPNGGKYFSPKQNGSLLPHGKHLNSEIKAFIKELNPKCQLVCGGPDAHDIDYNRIYDYVVKGYADVSAVNLARHLAYGDPLEKSYRSIYGFTVVDDALAAGYDFASSPMCYTDNHLMLPNSVIWMEVARGCIFKCKFCSFPLIGKKKNDHIKHEDVLYSEFMQNYEKFGVTTYLFVDDTFNDNRDKLEMFHRVVKRLPFKLNFWCFCRLDLLARFPETVDLLIDSGCRAMFFGIESFDKKAAAAIGKGGNRQQLIKVIQDIKSKYGDSVFLQGSFILGLPGETVESMKLTIDQLLTGSTGLDYWSVQALRLSPEKTAFSSELEKNYAAYGYRLGEYRPEQWTCLWESDQTSFLECAELAASTIAAGIKNGTKISSTELFSIANLGADLNQALTKSCKDFDWYSLSLMKENRIAEYKKLLRSQIGL